jgi:hypothetical protein
MAVTPSTCHAGRFRRRYVGLHVLMQELDESGFEHRRAVAVADLAEHDDACVP